MYFERLIFNKAIDIR